LFSTGSTNVFKVSADSSPTTGTQVQVLRMGFGPNESKAAVNGGTIRIVNVGTTPFAAGQVFTLVQEVGGGDFNNAGLNTTNAQPVIDPISPGPGLAWDLSGIIHHGTLGVISVNTNSAPLSFFSTVVPIVATNSSGTPTGTNFGSVLELHWPADRVGWELQQQAPTNALVSTNWTTIAGSTFTNDVFVTNVIGTNAAMIFYRMIYP
jgi:hypothetical protein